MDRSRYFVTAVKGLGVEVRGETHTEKKPDLSSQIFRKLIETDPACTDAYLGIIKSGTYTINDVERLYETRHNIGQQLSTCSLTTADLNVTWYTGFHIYSKIVDACSVAAFYIKELTDAKEYTAAENVFDSAGPVNNATLFAGAYLYYITQRWFDALECIKHMKIIPERAPDFMAAANLLGAWCYHHIGSYETSNTILESSVIDGHGIIVFLPKAQGMVALLCGLNSRALNKENDIDYFREAALDTQYRDDAQRYLSDSKLKPKTVNREHIDSRTNRWDPTTQSDPDELVRQALEEPRRAAAQEAHELLKNTIGMAGIKEQITTIQSGIRIGELRKKQGLKNQDRSHHIVVTGAPGVGKTTILRSLAKIYFSLGILDTPELIEVGRADLVGKYKGWTESQTRKYIAEAKEKKACLFIDEAYQLVDGGGGESFGKQAIDVLVSELENSRDLFVCALAGYPDSMNSFMESNEGLRRRFPNYLELPSYTGPELVAIAEHMAAEQDYRFTDTAKKIITETVNNLITNARPYRDGDTRPRPLIDHVGNAGFIRNVFEKAAAEQNTRIDASMASGTEPDLNALTELTGTDVYRALTKLLAAQYTDAMPEQPRIEDS